MASDEVLREPLTIACTSVTITPRDVVGSGLRVTVRVQTEEGEVVAVFVGDDTFGDEVYVERRRGSEFADSER